MPKPATSCGSDCEKPSRRPLRRVVGARQSRTRVMPPMLDTWMMWPEPCARMIGSAAWVTQSAPRRLRLELRARRFLAQLLDHAEVAVAGVVDDDVEAAEVLGGLLHGREVAVAVGDVEPDRQDDVAVGVDEGVERLEPAGRRGDAVAALERRFRPLAPEPLRCAGDEPSPHR